MFYKLFRIVVMVIIALMMVHRVFLFFQGSVNTNEMFVFLGFGALMELLIWKVFTLQKREEILKKVEPKIKEAEQKRKHAERLLKEQKELLKQEKMNNK